MITIKDVADRAGYAKSTVSRYINSSDYVAQQTGVAIQKAIDDLDYHPNQIARELSMGKRTASGWWFPTRNIHISIKLCGAYWIMR